MKKSDFYYELPESLIAQTPLEKRDSSRMLVYNRKSGEVQDRHFFDILEFLEKGDVLVVNNTKVLPARIFGKKESGATVEFLLAREKGNLIWEVLAKPAKRVKEGDRFIFSEKLSCIVTKEEADGIRELKFSCNGDFFSIIDNIGICPLPSYIKKDLEKIDRYQTVYAKTTGSCAAPTAGLHFTPELMERLTKKGIIFVNILLHVGIGTFRPVKEENIQNHKMHKEYYEVSEEAAKIINNAKKEKRRVVAVGTTSVRTLETVADESGLIKPSCGDTEIFIYPPYKFKAVDAMITNFHLPESTLIMLVSAFLEREKTLELYSGAVEKKYRFFSFGDACLFL